MSAQSLQVLTLVFSEPVDITSQTEFQRVNGSISFQYLTTFDIRTLSTNNANAGTDVTGLLYTPDLPPGDACITASAPFVPANVTRQANLPRVDFDLIAVAPWISPQCTLAYMAAARSAPTRGFIFFPPDNSTGEPAPANDMQWGLGDGGRWKRDNAYPVYVVPGVAGQLLLQQSNLYSGNMTSVPFGSDLSELYDSRDYVRLYVDLDTGSGSALPSLWVFLLVVLAILLAIIGLTSVAMHWVQRRRRQQLRDRVVNGDVDLEALGIKRLTVPQEVLDNMPLYTYGSKHSTQPEPTTAAASSSPPGKRSTSTSSRPSSPLPSTRPTHAFARTSSYHPTAFQQPTCAICLDDFAAPSPSTDEPGTIIRELPCHHIFHPDCVDTFLRDNSSLCPMCKKTVLPKGYCPKTVTNAMVRRERNLRRALDSNSGDDNINASLPPNSRNPHTLAQRLHARTLGRVTSSPLRPNQPLAELPSPATPRRSATSPLPLQDQPVPQSERGRREWARQRAVAMLGRRAPLDPDAEDAARTPRWRKVLGGLFPALGAR